MVIKIVLNFKAWILRFWVISSLPFFIKSVLIFSLLKPGYVRLLNWKHGRMWVISFLESTLINANRFRSNIHERSSQKTSRNPINQKGTTWQAQTFTWKPSFPIWSYLQGIPQNFKTLQNINRFRFHRPHEGKCMAIIRRCTSAL